jgi:hypothetical protein
MGVAMSLESVAKRRFDRRRKLLKNLKLKYPGDDERRKLAELAKVRPDHLSIFGQHICSLILDAHLGHSAFEGLSKSKTKTSLDSVAHQAQQLSNLLKTIDVGSGGSAAYTGFLLEMELGKVQSILLPEYVALLGNLNDAAKRGGSSIKSRRGERNSPFSLLVEGLVMAARQHGGEWTLYKAARQEWNGTLLEALNTLKEYLPQKFFPPGQLGRAAYYAKSKLNHHITKNRGA